MIRGRVINGDGVGKQLGWPTANLDVDPETTHLQDGVYAATARFHGREYGAAMVICRVRKRVEIYLIDYTGPDFYGDELEAEAVQQVSQLEKKDSVEELREKIGEDMKIINDVLHEQARHLFAD